MFIIFISGLIQIPNYAQFYFTVLTVLSNYTILELMLNFHIYLHKIHYLLYLHEAAMCSYILHYPLFGHIKTL